MKSDAVEIGSFCDRWDDCCTGVLTSWCEELGRLLLVRHQNSRSAAVTSVDSATTQKQVGYVHRIISSKQPYETPPCMTVVLWKYQV